MLPRHQSRGSVTRGHHLKLKKPAASKDIGKFFFTRRVVETWNSLPSKVVEAPSVNSFKNRIDRHWSSLDIKFDIDTALTKESPFTATGGAGNDLRQCNPWGVQRVVLPKVRYDLTSFIFITYCRYRTHMTLFYTSYSKSFIQP